MTDWPDPVEILNPSGPSDIVLLCEHASNHIPPEYDGLGLSSHDLMRHIAWDPGAAAVTRHLAKLLDAPAYLGTFSRLLIDLNRPLEAASSIVTRSESTDISRNMEIGAKEARFRAERIFSPFHETVAAVLDQRQRDEVPTRLVSIHSFTPVYLGVARPWHAGVLFDKAEAFGRGLVEALRQPGIMVDANVPYTSSRDEDYGVPVHGDDRGIPAVLIEIRHDLITDDKGAAGWAMRLAAALGTTR